MSESLLPEMIHAGVEAMVEAERQEFDIYQKVVAVWMAMQAIQAISEMRKPQETVH